MNQLFSNTLRDKGFLELRYHAIELTNRDIYLEN